MDVNVRDERIAADEKEAEKTRILFAIQDPPRPLFPEIDGRPTLPTFLEEGGNERLDGERPPRVRSLSAEDVVSYRQCPVRWPN